MRKINFESVRWKNFFLAGDTWITIDLDRSPSTLLVGKNGTGKSTAYEALHVCLFGAPIRKLKKKNDVINTKNGKAALIETRFSIGEDKYLVRRGFKPDVFEIEKNGALMDQEASARDMQIKLNRDILKSDKVGFQITTQISKAGIQMFMSLKAEERRKFIDDMLECTVFTEMSKLHKGRYDALKSTHAKLGSKLDRSQTVIEGKRSEIETAAAMVETMEQRHREAIDAQIAQARVRLDGVVADIKSAEADVERQKIAIEVALADAATYAEEAGAVVAPEKPEKPDTSGRDARAKKIKDAGSLIVDLKAKIRSTENSLGLLRAGYCGSCRQEVSEDHIAAETAKDNAQIETYRSALSDLQVKVDGWQAEHDSEAEALAEHSTAMLAYERAVAQISAIEAKAENAKSKADSARAEMTRALARVDSLKKKIGELIADVEALKASRDEPHEDEAAAVRVETLRGELASAEAAFEDLKREYDAATVDVEYAGMIAAMLKDGGIKTVVVKKFLPIINRVVNEKLAELGFYGRFTMDENFDEVIQQPGGVEMTFNQFSEGEKLRINLALILAWREIAMLQGRMHSNLLMFDETLDASLDDDGYEALTEIFKSLEDLNVFIVSHSPDRLDSFIRSKIQFVREGGFSRIADVSIA